MSDISKAKKVFISYLDDNDDEIKGYVDLISIKDGLVTFKTNDNIIHIPSNRVKKIKEKVSDDV